MRVLRSRLAGDEADAFVAALRDLELFAPLSDEQFRKVLFFTKAVEFDAGEIVFEKGEEGDAFYVVRQGAAEARVPGFFGHSVIGRMGPGDFFGELALLLHQPRVASIVCVETTVCLALDRADLEILMEKHPDVAAAIKSVAKQRFDDSPERNR